MRKGSFSKITLFSNNIMPSRLASSTAFKRIGVLPTTGFCSISPRDDRYGLRVRFRDEVRVRIRLKVMVEMMVAVKG